MSSKLNVGLIGLGRLGNLYARYFLGRISRANLQAIAEPREGVAESFAAENGVPRWYTDYRDMLAAKEIDAVLIVTPTNTHRDIAIEATQAGKAIFCEKPLSLSIEESLDVKQAIDRSGVYFQMGFMRRFDRGYAAARQKIVDGVVGTPVLVKSSARDPFRPSLEYLNPKNSGGLIIDCGIHDIDVARWLMGEIDQVYSIGGVLAYPEMKEIDDIDNAVVTLRFASGALGVMDISRNGIYGYDIRTEILGTKGTLKIGYLRETPLMVLTKEGATHDTVPYFMERFDQAYVDQLQAFVDNVLANKPPPVTCDDGIAALKIALAASLSFREGRPISLRE
jgi:scyllo-inositol 2-dehydrogenase (NAD+)